jgi:hypothetical protein
MMIASAWLERGVLAVAIATVLAGCEARGNGMLLPSSTAGTDSQTHQQRFKYTGRKQTFTVPSGVTEIKVVAEGAAGVGASHGFGGGKSKGGNGGRLIATVTVTGG